MTERHTSAFTVPASHASLPGHFPSTPVVPGVVVLDLVLEAAASWLQRAVPVSGLRQVKFHTPLLPEQRADVALETAGDALRFQVMRDQQLIAQGTFTITGALPARS